MVEILDITRPLFFNDVTTFKGEEKRIIEKDNEYKSNKIKSANNFIKNKEKITTFNPSRRDIHEYYAYEGKDIKDEKIWSNVFVGYDPLN
ncbi:MAG: hypothetical protein U9532_04035 ['Conium maculatum' witches'-broom phytoplasma]|nr:hypothetical protein ['Conium maculatum' witches'-broom phytoplasma]